MKNGISLVIADDHEIFRDGLALMLSKQEAVKLVGQAGDGHALCQLVDEMRPDMVLTDIKMPRMDGIAAARILLISAFGPALAITVLTAMIVALTLAPALIAIFGSGLFWPGPRSYRRLRRETASAGQVPPGRRYGLREQVARFASPAHAGACRNARADGITPT